MDYEDLRKSLFGDNPAKKNPATPPVTLADLFRANSAPSKPVVRVRLAGPTPVTPIRLVPLKKPKVFVSFDYENDRLYKQLLDAWDANKRFDFTFQSHTPSEVQSYNIGRIKAVLTAKVKDATHVVVLVGKYANQIHPDTKLIGFRNWINFEIHQARLYKKKIVCVMLKPDNTFPEMILHSGASLVGSFNEKDIIEALKK